MDAAVCRAAWVPAAAGCWSTAWGAFGVLDRWTQSPRYGFVSDFAPGRIDAEVTMQELARCHLNGPQFCYWIDRHEQLLAPQDPYCDPLGRELSQATVDDLIAAAHARGIAAMPYTSVYGAARRILPATPGLVDVQPVRPASFVRYHFLAITNPRPNFLWTQQLLEQFDQVLQQTHFDGLHLDQYGDPKVGYDAQGRSFALDTALAALIDAAQA